MSRALLLLMLLLLKILTCLLLKKRWGLFPHVERYLIELVVDQVADIPYPVIGSVRCPATGILPIELAISLAFIGSRHSRDNYIGETRLYWIQVARRIEASSMYIIILGR